MRFLLHRFPAVGGLLLFALLCAAMAGTQYFRSHGATITVTNTNDNGPGSFRQALVDVFDGGTIQFSSALNGQTISLTSGELLINKSITITGPGPALLTVARNPGAPNFRILHLSPNRTVEIDGLTITHGWLEGSGGGILIDDHTTLTIINCAVSGNLVRSEVGILTSGGGIHNQGTLSPVNSTVSGNTSMSTGSNGGGGIHNEGTLTITQSNISGNSGDNSGGGILNSTGAILSISDSTVSNNQSRTMFRSHLINA